jgi:hypothetical protein
VPAGGSDAGHQLDRRAGHFQLDDGAERDDPGGELDIEDPGYRTILLCAMRA